MRLNRDWHSIREISGIRGSYHKLIIVIDESVVIGCDLEFILWKLGSLWDSDEYDKEHSIFQQKYWNDIIIWDLYEDLRVNYYMRVLEEWSCDHVWIWEHGMCQPFIVIKSIVKS